MAIIKYKWRIYTLKLKDVDYKWEGFFETLKEATDHIAIKPEEQATDYKIREVKPEEMKCCEPVCNGKWCGSWSD